MLYGDVGRWDSVRAKDIISLLNEAKTKGAKKINLRIHSGGGSVFEAFAIYNAIKNLGVSVYAYVDGLAASMASIIMQGAEKIYISTMARVMTHQSRAMSVSGTATQLRNMATQLETINGQFADIYAEKTGKSKEWVTQNWLPEGKDVWFTAQQAKEVGLVDELVEPPKNLVPVKAFDDTNIVACYDEVFANFDFQQTEGSMPSLNNPSNTMEMVQIPKKDILAMLEALGVGASLQGNVADANLGVFLGEKINAVAGKLQELQKLKASVVETEKAKIVEKVKAIGGDLVMQTKYVQKYELLGLEVTLDILNDIQPAKDLTAVQSAGGDIVAGGNGRDWANVPQRPVANGKDWQEMAIQNPEDYVKLAEQNPALFAWFVGTEGAKL
jgi:ATP-dependent Clp endopeptidase proteolytic subunit ClpP